MFDPRYLSGPASILIGTLLITAALRLWLVHPVNRVFRIGPFVTERGMRAVINMRVILFSAGVWVIVNGLAKSAFWFLHQDAHHPLIQFLGTLETGLALWVLILAVAAAVQVWRVR